MIPMEQNYGLPMQTSMIALIYKDGVTWPSDYIPGATSVSYTPTTQRRGTMYYRVEVTDNDTEEKVFSEPAKIKLRSCQLPVNHNTSVMEYYDDGL